MSFSLSTLDQLVAGLDATCEWLESIGITVRGSRLEAIRGELEKLELVHQDRGDAALLQSWSNLNTALLLADTLAFTSIERQFRELKPNLLPRRALRTILEGPLMVQLLDRHPTLFDSPVDTRIIASLAIFRLVAYSEPRRVLMRVFAGPFVPLVESEHLQLAEKKFIHDLSRFLLRNANAKTVKAVQNDAKRIYIR